MSAAKTAGLVLMGIAAAGFAATATIAYSATERAHDAAQTEEATRVDAQPSMRGPNMIVGVVADRGAARR